MSNEVTIAIDTREQAPLSGFTLPSVRATLKTGDYSVVGAEHLFAVERKTVSDLIGTLTTGRERFERELVRLSEMRRACIVVEGDLDTIIGWRYRSKVSPRAWLARSRRSSPGLAWRPCSPAR